MPFDKCARIVRCIAEMTQHAHNRGVVHRDVKPSNVMLVPADRVSTGTTLPFVPRITDFGMAKLIERRLEDTNSSVMPGTPCYMAPKQFSYDGGSKYPFAVDI